MKQNDRYEPGESGVTNTPSWPESIQELLWYGGGPQTPIAMSSQLFNSDNANSMQLMVCGQHGLLTNKQFVPGIAVVLIATDLFICQPVEIANTSTRIKPDIFHTNDSVQASLLHSTN